MQTVVGQGLGRILIINAHRGENVIRTITDAVKQNNMPNAVILSGVATFQKLNTHSVNNSNVIPEETHVTVDGAYEVTGVDGLILNYVPHIHIAAQDHGKTVIAHLENDTEFLYVGEIIIGEILGDINLEREKKETGESIYVERKRENG